jgi:acetyltransferase
VNLTPLFDPERIAVVGASRSERKIGHETMRNAVAFDGPVHPVNPSAEGELLGKQFVGSVTEVDEPIDLALLCVPGPALPDVLAECGEAGVGGAVVYGGGFAEAGEAGRRRQARLAEIADENDVALLGPNTSGFVIPRTNLLASFVGGVEQFDPGPVAVVAQSGGVAHAIGFRALREGRGLSAMVGLGNRASVGFEEAITYFDGDGATDAIVIHIEGTDTGRELLETCRAASTPVVAYKIGESDVGDFAESHTGALTGDHELYDAGFAQYGVPTVDSTAGLLDAGVSLAASPVPGGTGVGVVTAQAGPGIIVADRLRAAGASVPDLEPETAERVEAILPGITYAENPVDTGRPMPEFGGVVTAVAEDDNTDVVLIYELFEGALGFPVDALDGLAERVGKPVLFATGGPEAEMAEARAALEDVDVPVFHSPERAADAAATLVRYAAVSDRGVSADV